MIVGALVLAAGRGTRMGGINKLTAPLHGRAVVAHVVAAVHAAGLPPPLVVVGDREAEVRAALADADVRFVAAPDHAAGQSASLRAGIAAVPAAWSAVLVLLGDMPGVAPVTIAAIAAAAGEIVVPRYAGTRGNPVRWPRALFPALLTLDGDTGGRALFAVHPPAYLDVDDPAILADVDTVDDLAGLQRSCP